MYKPIAFVLAVATLSAAVEKAGEESGADSRRVSGH